MANAQEFLSYAIYGVIVMTLAEAVILYFRREGSPSETLANVAIYGVGRGWREFVVDGIEIVFYGGLAALTPLALSDAWWAFPLTLGVVDFAYYWKHRWEHEVRVLWAYHSVHHSSEHFNLSTALRLPWLGSFLGMLFYAPLVLIGFNPLLVLLSRRLVLLYQYWIHTEKIGRMGWFDRFFNSPSNHRVHHGSNPLYLDRNHGGILIVWDRLFGTYQGEVEPVRYGLTHPIGTRNPVAINFHEPLAILRDVRRAGGLLEALGYIFRGPGWTPAPIRSLPRQSAVANVESLPR